MAESTASAEAAFWPTLSSVMALFARESEVRCLKKDLTIWNAVLNDESSGKLPIRLGGQCPTNGL